MLSADDRYFAFWGFMFERPLLLSCLMRAPYHSMLDCYWYLINLTCIKNPMKSITSTQSDASADDRYFAFWGFIMYINLMYLWYIYIWFVSFLDHESKDFLVLCFLEHSLVSKLIVDLNFESEPIETSTISIHIILTCLRFQN